ncbi:hypothetical protein CH352_05165 [Leptospira hartskeerlii]|uniref:Uncharacterized protein n=1 Tax=Leptospira hartskeerlii TaxID=2023177 RepID=A0A2M9XFQ1_9LEPT|nr:hypothetical protein [Leptospira hartskeerlii]PJZ26535.1 hypothetical protein CH357_03290 [Leptospira hartskeerlii]PJZ34983.1 hypothetical protein CH352_05165 [Leptospira hartskeerlii]
MKKILVFFFSILIAASNCQSFGQSKSRELTESFKEVLRNSGVLIRQIVPPNFTPVTIDPNVLFRYNYAIKSNVDGVEIRYRVESIPEYLKEFEDFKKKNPKAILVSPKKEDYLQEFVVNLQNLAGSPENIYSSRPFPSKAVKDEFGADWGSNSFLDLNPGYEEPYKHCLLVALHKDGVANVYIMYLSNDKEKLLKFVKGTYLFYNIRFQ